MDFIDKYVEEINESILYYSKILGTNEIVDVMNTINSKKNKLFQEIVKYFLEFNDTISLPSLYAILDDYIFHSSGSFLELINIILLKSRLQHHYNIIEITNKH